MSLFFPTSMLRPLRPVLSRTLKPLSVPRSPCHRLLSSSPLPTPQSRLARINARLPRFLHRYTTGLLNAPVSHVSAFVLLHEFTAVVPLLGLTAVFHYTNWLPPFFSEGVWIKGGVERFGRWFKRRGWVASGEEAELEADVRTQSESGRVKGFVERFRGNDTRKGWIKSKRGAEQDANGGEHVVEGEGGTASRRPKGTSKRARWAEWWDRSELGTRLVIEFATSYAIVKALLIPRVMLSVWATPWFARVAVMPAWSGIMRRLGRGSRTKGGPIPAKTTQAATKAPDPVGSRSGKDVSQ